MRNPRIRKRVNREERGRSAAHGDACRAAEALFVSWVVEMGAWDVCEAVGTVAVAHRSNRTLSEAEGEPARGHFVKKGVEGNFFRLKYIIMIIYFRN